MHEQPTQISKLQKMVLRFRGLETKSSISRESCLLFDSQRYPHNLCLLQNSEISFHLSSRNWLLWLLILEVVKLTESFLRGSLELIYSYPFRSNFKELKKEESELNRDLRHNPYCLQMHTCDWITTVQLDNLCLLRN